MDKVEFRYYLGKNKDTVSDLSHALGVHKNTLYNKIGGRIAFTLADIAILKERWQLSAVDVEKIFFNN